jgi:hypothetical protein
LDFLTDATDHVFQKYERFSGQSSAYLLSVLAVSEPETYGMLLAGLGLMGFIARRRLTH